MTHTVQCMHDCSIEYHIYITHISVHMFGVEHCHHYNYAIDIYLIIELVNSYLYTCYCYAGATHK